MVQELELELEQGNVKNGDILNKVWWSSVPLKIQAFVWRAIQDHIPSKQNLVSRDIVIPNEACCHMVEL
ncbi:unnamed protein product [Sphenostylis stenocarpa]|uniref:Reverse transcriptase zinc-binding domain-containing protein n=1 Tax=Sphenostylis stenocarpa TaxID=92480 RepID=A0AA86T5D0_9FABA|nr:unnamed protein product [Sphenostylis stenocarpa]